MNTKCSIYATAAFLSLVVLATPIRADELQLFYSVEPYGTGLTLYDFQLELTNADGSWVPGQGWGWIVFGDCELCSSPLADWTGLSEDSPYNAFWITAGFHNGRTLAPPGTYWVPNAVGDTLDWSGTSTADLGQGQLLFSTILTENDAEAASFQAATLVPDPGSLFLLATAVGLAGFLMHFRQHRVDGRA